MRPTPKPPVSAGLTNGDILMFQVSHLTNRGSAVKKNHAHLSGRKLDLSVFSFLGHQLRIFPCTSNQLPSVSDAEL